MEDPFLAEIRYVPARFAPSGWAWCDGREMLISEHPALFKLLGTTYGGDGQSTFALPNLVGRKPVQIASHSVSITPADHSEGPKGLAGNTLPSHKTHSYRETNFCIALQGVFPVSST